MDRVFTPLGLSPCRNADTVEALLQSLVFRLNLTRQARAKLREELPLRGDLILPIGTIDLQQFFQRASGQIESLALDAIWGRDPTDGGFNSLATAAHPLQDPFQYPHVLSKTRPEEIALGVCAEPINLENLRRL